MQGKDLQVTNRRISLLVTEELEDTKKYQKKKKNYKMYQDRGSIMSGRKKVNYLLILYNLPQLP